MTTANKCSAVLSGVTIYSLKHAGSHHSAAGYVDPTPEDGDFSVGDQLTWVDTRATELLPHLKDSSAANNQALRELGDMYRLATLCSAYGALEYNAVGGAGYRDSCLNVLLLDQNILARPDLLDKLAPLSTLGVLQVVTATARVTITQAPVLQKVAENLKTRADACLVIDLQTLYQKDSALYFELRSAAIQGTWEGSNLVAATACSSRLDPMATAWSNRFALQASTLSLIEAQFMAPFGGSTIAREFQRAEPHSKHSDLAQQPFGQLFQALNSPSTKEALTRNLTAISKVMVVQYPNNLIQTLATICNPPNGGVGRFAPSKSFFAAAEWVKSQWLRFGLHDARLEAVTLAADDLRGAREWYVPSFKRRLVHSILASYEPNGYRLATNRFYQAQPDALGYSIDELHAKYSRIERLEDALLVELQHLFETGNRDQLCAVVPGLTSNRARELMTVYTTQINSSETLAFFRKNFEEPAIQSFNVVGTRLPDGVRSLDAYYEAGGREIVLVPFHLDAVGHAPLPIYGPNAGTGANDDGTGAAAVVETVRIFDQLKLPHQKPIIFAGMTAEELGCLGSKPFYRNTLDNRFRYAIANCDMVVDAADVARPHVSLFSMGKTLDPIFTDAGVLQLFRDLFQVTVRPDHNASAYGERVDPASAYAQLAELGGRFEGVVNLTQVDREELNGGHSAYHSPGDAIRTDGTAVSPVMQQALDSRIFHKRAAFFAGLVYLLSL